MAEYVEPEASARPSLASQFFQLSLTIDCGRINASTGLLKPNPYVEVTVDGKPPKKTETVKSTYQPRWNESITVLVTPYSKILFRLYDHSTFKKDALLGEHTLNLFNVLKTRDGKCQNSTMSLEMQVSSSNNEAKVNNGHNSKIGELVIVLDGLSIDMKAVASTSPPVAVSVVPSPFPPEPEPRGHLTNSSSKQRRRTAGDSAERLPPLAKTQSASAGGRGSSSTSSLNNTAPSAASSSGTPTASNHGESLEASRFPPVTSSSFESPCNSGTSSRELTPPGLTTLHLQHLPTVGGRRLLLPPIHQTIGQL